MKHRPLSRIAVGVIAGCSAVTAAIPMSSAGATSSRPVPLVGTFQLTAGSCSGTTPTGTYFRMIYPGGTLTGGKFFTNPDSTCTDKTYTLAVPGTAGGLKTGTYQPSPTPAFSTGGGALASAIVQPASFTGIDFSVATSSKDPQTGTAVPPPTISVSNGKLSGQVQAWSAAWNNLYFNQGSPKPGGSKPGLTSSLSGTYNAKTRAFVLVWASAVVGGPFNGFAGYWHLQGTFKPAKSR